MLLTDKHMDLLTREELKTLLTPQEGPCVSIYMPTHRLWNEAVQDPIRLKNLLRQTEDKLNQSGLRAPEVREFLTPARDLLEGHDSFWRHQSDGLALFLTPSSFASYRLPIDFGEEVITGSRFYVKPLLRFLAYEGHFFLLALNQKQVRLYQATPHSISEIDLGDVPQSLAEAMQYDDFESHLDFHTGSTGGSQAGAGGRRDAVFHGQGAAGDEANVKENILRFFRTLDNGVTERLAQETAPLLVAGVEYLCGLYREANHYRNLIDECIDANPEAMSTEALHERAWAIMEPRFQQSRRKAAEAFDQVAGKEPERAVGMVEGVVPAAYFQRVDTLFAPVGRHAWGTFDAEAETVTLQDEAQPGAEDLLDLAVAHTLLNGGTAHIVEPADVPGGGPVAAILRY
jgi:hypothetical protein